MIYVNGNKIVDLNVGGAQPEKAYVDGTLVWERWHPGELDSSYFTLFDTQIHGDPQQKGFYFARSGTPTWSDLGDKSVSSNATLLLNAYVSGYYQGVYYPERMLTSGNYYPGVSTNWTSSTLREIDYEAANSCANGLYTRILIPKGCIGVCLSVSVFNPGTNWYYAMSMQDEYFEVNNGNDIWTTGWCTSAPSDYSFFIATKYNRTGGDQRPYYMALHLKSKNTGGVTPYRYLRASNLITFKLKFSY